MRHEIFRLAEPYLERQQAVLEKQGFAVCIRAPRGYPTEELVRVADEQSAHLIVVGSHGHTLAHGALLFRLNWIVCCGTLRHTSAKQEPRLPAFVQHHETQRIPF